MNVPANVRPGDFGLVSMGGFGKVIRVLQWMDGSGFANYEHAFVYVGGLTSHNIVEADPSGAKQVEFHYDPKTVVWSSNLVLTDSERVKVCEIAESFVGTPYSFLDYASLVAKRIHLPVIGLQHYIASTNHMICSQLVAACYQAAGIPLYKTWTGNVTPGDLYDLLEGKPYVA